MIELIFLIKNKNKIWTTGRFTVNLDGLLFCFFREAFIRTSRNFYAEEGDIKIINLNMPQLVPFFFVNQVIFNFVILTIIIYLFSKYILPRFVRLFKTRLHINSL